MESLIFEGLCIYHFKWTFGTWYESSFSWPFCGYVIYSLQNIFNEYQRWHSNHCIMLFLYLD